MGSVANGAVIQDGSWIAQRDAMKARLQNTASRGLPGGGLPSPQGMNQQPRMISTPSFRYPSQNRPAMGYAPSNAFPTGRMTSLPPPQAAQQAFHTKVRDTDGAKESSPTQEDSSESLFVPGEAEELYKLQSQSWNFWGTGTKDSAMPGQTHSASQVTRRL